MRIDDFNPDARISRDKPIPPNTEAAIMKEIEGREYISVDEFYRLLENAGLDKKRSKRGTYLPEESGCLYVYAKKNFISPDLALAKEKLLLCQELTRHGGLFPETKWGIFQRPSGQFQIFAVTRKLEHAPPSEDPLRNSKILHERLGPEYDHFIDDGEANRNPMGHLPGSKDLYPIDIEVIAFAFEEREAIDRETAFQDASKPKKIINLRN